MNYSFQIVELVCDFIRDEDDKLYLTQVKGLRLSPSSFPSIKNWVRLQEESRDLDDDERVDAAEEYRKKLKNVIIIISFFLRFCFLFLCFFVSLIVFFYNIRQKKNNKIQWEILVNFVV